MQPTREQLAALARQLALTSPDEIDCDAVLDRVGAYLEATHRDEPLSPELQAVAAHLEVCPECLEEFEALLAAHEIE